MRLRRIHQDDHDRYIAANKVHIRVSGPLRRDDLGRPVGGLWYIEAKNRSAAEALCHQSPFWKAGVFASVTVMTQQASTNPYASMRVTCL